MRYGLQQCSIQGEDRACICSVCKGALFWSQIRSELKKDTMGYLKQCWQRKICAGKGKVKAANRFKSFLTLVFVLTVQEESCWETREGKKRARAKVALWGDVSIWESHPCSRCIHATAMSRLCIFIWWRNGDQTGSNWKWWRQEHTQDTDSVNYQCFQFSFKRKYKQLEIFLSFFSPFLDFQDRISQCSPGTHFVDHTGLELRDLPSSWMLGL